MLVWSDQYLIASHYTLILRHFPRHFCRLVPPEGEFGREQTDGRTNKCREERRNEQTEEQKNDWTNEQTDGRTKERTNINLTVTQLMYLNCYEYVNSPFVMNN